MGKVTFLIYKKIAVEIRPEMWKVDYLLAARSVNLMRRFRGPAYARASRWESRPCRQLSGARVWAAGELSVASGNYALQLVSSAAAPVLSLPGGYESGSGLQRHMDARFRADHARSR